MSEALPLSEVAQLAESIRELLRDPEASLSRDTRLRWEGALTALEAVLGAHPSLPPGAAGRGL